MAARNRSPSGARPELRAMVVDTQVSSMKTRREMIDAFLRAILLARDERFFEGDANAAEGNSSSPTYPL